MYNNKRLTHRGNHVNGNGKIGPLGKTTCFERELFLKNTTCFERENFDIFSENDVFRTGAIFDWFIPTSRSAKFFLATLSLEKAIRGKVAPAGQGPLFKSRRKEQRDMQLAHEIRTVQRQ